MRTYFGTFVLLCALAFTPSVALSSLDPVDEPVASGGTIPVGDNLIWLTIVNLGGIAIDPALLLPASLPGYTVGQDATDSDGRLRYAGRSFVGPVADVGIDIYVYSQASFVSTDFIDTLAFYVSTEGFTPEAHTALGDESALLAKDGTRTIAMARTGAFLLVVGAVGLTPTEAFDLLKMVEGNLP